MSEGFEERYDEIVFTLYRAATGKESWSTACNHLAEALGLLSVQITGIEKRTGATQFSWDGGEIRPEAWLEYFTSHHNENPRIPATVGLSPGEWFHDHESFDVAVLEKSVFYRDFLIPNNVGYCSATKLIEDGEFVVLLAAHSAYSSPPLTAREIHALERVRGHLIQAIEIYRVLQRGQTDSLVARRTLDALAQNVLLVDETGFVHYANKPAENLLQKSDLVYERDGYVRCVNADDSNRLNEGLRRLDLSQSATKLPGQVLLPLGADSEGRARLITVAIAVRPEATMGMFGVLPRAILLMHPLEPGADVDPVILTHAFGLTAAEAAITSMLARGKTVQEIADDRRVSRETIRAQLKSAYAKVGVSSQVALISVVSQMPREHLARGGRQIVL